MKVISFGVWGNDEMYLTGIGRNCWDIKNSYPDWEPWVYYNNTVPSETIEEIISMNVKVIHIDNKTNDCSNSIWRFQPCFDDSVDLFLSRDCDSRITPREMELVNNWIKSQKELHIIRDHRYHQKPIMAGMFGIKRGDIMNILKKELLDLQLIIKSGVSYRPDLREYQVDENFLETKVFPFSFGKSMSHVSAGALYPDDIVISKSDTNFIGCKMDSEGNPKMTYLEGFRRFNEN
jgi:hypothetical protein